MKSSTPAWGALPTQALLEYSFEAISMQLSSSTSSPLFPQYFPQADAQPKTHIYHVRLTTCLLVVLSTSGVQSAFCQLQLAFCDFWDVLLAF